jgi:uncharacterized protein with ATP-grasp and redox domains
VIKQNVNQLEENYHFDLEKRSFIYRGKKAFIIDIREYINRVNPFLHYRNELNDFIEFTFNGTKKEEAERFYKYISKCMGIIGNMLDEEKMGSIKNYMDHIQKEFDIALEETKDAQPMMTFINNISNIITMIDYCVEIQLSKITTEESQSIIAQSIVKNISPDANIIEAFNITEDGSIKRIKIKQMKDEENKDKYDLAKMQPLNKKEI